MKTKLNILFIAAAFAALAGVLSLFIESSQAQITIYQPGGYDGVATLLPGTQATVAASTTANPTNSVFQSFKTSDFASQAILTGSNAGDTTTVTLQYVPSFDGVTFATTHWDHVITLNGTTPVISQTNFVKSNGFGLAKFVKLNAIVNANTHTITNGGITVFQFAP